MTIAEWADWATVIAIIGAPIAGLVWWWWKRRKRRERMSDISEQIEEALKLSAQLTDLAAALIKQEDVTESQKIYSQLIMIWNTLQWTSTFTVADFMLTHIELPAFPRVKFQSPVVAGEST